ncbi:hypothetical protein BH10ACI2_BH10ACI2_06840 [soil metagenome]
MVCEHLSALEHELIQNGAVELSRGSPWSKNCREWVYFDVFLDTTALIKRFDFGPEVEFHENTDPRSGLERGLVCSVCHDAVIGVVSGAKVYR